MLNENYVKFSCNAISYSEYIKNEGLDYNILPDSPTPDDIELCRGTNLIPLFRDIDGCLVVGYVNEDGFSRSELQDVRYQEISFYDFRVRYQKYYGMHPKFYSIPIKLFADLIIKFALENKASDISTYVDGDWVKTFLTAKGKKIRCSIEIPRQLQRDLILYLTSIDINQCEHTMKQYADVDLDSTHMGRCIVGFPEPDETAATIRVQDSSIFNLTLKDLNLSEEVYEFLKNKFADARGGLRLVSGKTASGKNTTILAVLKEFINEDKYKIVSVESPVERKLPGVIQYNCKDDEQVKDCARGLIRENPDKVYFAEITDAIGEYVLTTANTGVCVISTLHDNSVEDVLIRLHTITGRTYDELVQVLHSVVFQRLVYDSERDILVPKCQFCDFNEELKLKIIGKSLADMIKIIKENTHGDNDIF